MTHSKNSPNEQALADFLNHREGILNILEELTAITTDFLAYSPEDINWGHVGTAAHIKSELARIAHTAGLDTNEILNS